MKQLIILLLMPFALFTNCKNAHNPAEIGKNLIGKWEQDVPAKRGSAESFEITTEGDEYVVDSYVAYKKDTRYVKINGDTVMMKAGTTDKHKKFKLTYDDQKKVYQFNKMGFLADINIINDDRLELKLPGQVQIYNRVK